MKLRLALLLSVAGLALAPAGALAAGNFANAGIAGASSTNPIAGMKWGVYHGTLDGLYSAWQSATGKDKKLLAKEALQPLMYWFGSWDPDSLATQYAQQYIQSVTHGNANELTQMAIFRLVPWEGQCGTLPTATQVASYKDWITNWAQGIGNARVVMDLQPDLPILACVSDGSQVPAQEVSYAAQVFSALPRTTVYLDAGSADWEAVGAVVSQLREAGIQYTRGFALNATHYDSIAAELTYGKQIVQALAAAGVPGMHFIINTADNGKPFGEHQKPAEFKSGLPCASKSSTECVTLGVPPTTDVTANAKALGIDRAEVAIARKYCDAYLWYGRPWLYKQDDPFMLKWALKLAETTPF